MLQELQPSDERYCAVYKMLQPHCKYPAYKQYNNKPDPWDSYDPDFDKVEFHDWKERVLFENPDYIKDHPEPLREGSPKGGSAATKVETETGTTKVKAESKVYNPLRKGAGSPKPYEGEGELQPLSAMILMSVLYAARIARYDLFKPIQFLAKRITKWDKRCDLRLHQVMSYIHDTMEYCAYGFIGDNPKDLTLH